MTPEFKQDLTDHITFLKKRGDTAEESLREAERFCSRNGGEFREGGKEVVEAVYDGKFSTRQGGLLGFDPNTEPPEAAVAATVVTPPEPLVSTATAVPTFGEPEGVNDEQP